MLNEDFAACFTKIGPYKRDESMLALLKMLDAERSGTKNDGPIYRVFGSAASLAAWRVHQHHRFGTETKNWTVY